MAIYKHKKVYKSPKYNFRDNIWRNIESHGKEDKNENYREKS